MRELTALEILCISGGNSTSDDDIPEITINSSNGNGWSFAGAVLAISAATIAICTAPAWGAVGAVISVGSIGAMAMSNYSKK